MKTYVKDLKKGDQLEGEVFAIEEIQLHKTQSGDPYYNLTLQDKTGQIKAKIWSKFIENCEVEDLKRGDVVEIWGGIEEYRGSLQLVIKSLKFAESYDVSVLIKVSERDIDQMWDDLVKKIDGMGNQYLKGLLQNIFADEDIVAKYRSAPGGEYVHHGFVGGLLEHVWEMLDFAAPYQKYYPEADYDLVTTGIILHDIGKIIEINQVGTVFEFSTEGALLGHMQLGLELAYNNRPEGMPRKLWMHLAHIIISHNGIYAEMKPVTIEAEIVSVVDFGSSRVRQYQQHMQEGLEKPDEISQYSKFLESRVYIGDRVWE